MAKITVTNCIDETNLSFTMAELIYLPGVYKPVGWSHFRIVSNNKTLFYINPGTGYLAWIDNYKPYENNRFVKTNEKVTVEFN